MDKKLVLSDTLRQLVKERKLTLKKLSSESGVPISSLSEAINDDRMLSPRHLLKLSRYFEVSIETLLTGESTQYAALESLLAEDIFEGFLKVKIQRVVPKKGKSE